ncbi:hypothetical protein [Escherichia coli]|uniref:hypothetical protein n=1 Tax=Escherichia coli TaxID=562 RepID=UPI000AF75ADA|nr:hypothetical protein [Escherichia coli]
MTDWLAMPSKLFVQFSAAWIKQVPDLLFSYLHLTLSGVFLLLFLRSHYLSAG